jgi:hypothetical protein
MAETKNKMGFLSSKYRDKSGMTSAQNIVMTQTIQNESRIYMKPMYVYVFSSSIACTGFFIQQKTSFLFALASTFPRADPLSFTDGFIRDVGKEAHRIKRLTNALSYLN